MVELTLFLISFVFFMIWFIFTKLCIYYKEYNDESIKHKTVKFPLLFYVIAFIIMLIPIINVLSCGIFLGVILLSDSSDMSDIYDSLSGEVTHVITGKEFISKFPFLSKLTSKKF